MKRNHFLRLAAFVLLPASVAIGLVALFRVSSPHQQHLEPRFQHRGPSFDKSFPRPSFASRQIHDDLKIWRDVGGITLEMLHQAEDQLGVRCVRTRAEGTQLGADAFRFQIIDGQLYIDSSKLGPCCGVNDWWPNQWSQRCSLPGEMPDLRSSITGHPCYPELQCIEGRAPLMILGLLEMLQKFPGQAMALTLTLARTHSLHCFSRSQPSMPMA